MSHCPFLLALLMTLLTLQTCSAFKQFQQLIPNGDRVPNPCSKGAIWEGVGHVAQQGGVERSQFGLDFLALGKKWTKELCQLDSDGDGKTNGQELGDPNCRWTPGASAPPPVSHPGICEPLSNPFCQSRNVKIECTNVTSPHCDIDFAATRSVDLRLNRTEIPSSETTYMCQIFDVPVDGDYQMVATKPLIETPDIVHHILLFGCDPKADLERVTSEPYRCIMVPDKSCRSLIGAWTLGSFGDCSHPEMGFRMGIRGYTHVALQVHWNNAFRQVGLTDTSGLRIFLTKNLRKNDAGMLVLGQRFLQVEPLGWDEAVQSDLSSKTSSSRYGSQGRVETEDAMSFSASCPGRCTKFMFRTPIYITAAVNHMHFIGKSQRIEVYRNGSLIAQITDQRDYKYDDPRIYSFDQAIRVEPGDELRTTCVYKRPETSQPVCWGEATSDEMCFGFLTYYPLQSLSLPWCTSMKSLPSCDRHLPQLGKHPIKGCNWWEFRDPRNNATRKALGGVLMKCYKGRSLGDLTCTEKCKEMVQMIVNHPCLQGDIGSYMIDRFKMSSEEGAMFVEAILTCSCRKFGYCEKNLPRGMLGTRQKEFCSKGGVQKSTANNVLLYLDLVIVATFLLNL